MDADLFAAAPSTEVAPATNNDDLFAMPAATDAVIPAAAAASDDLFAMPAATSPAVMVASPVNTSPMPLESLNVELSSQSSFEESPLRAWEKKHAEVLMQKGKEESDRHQKQILQARADMDEFTKERDARCAAKLKQNEQEEELFRETQSRIFKEGEVWVQASKIVDFQKKRAAGEKEPARMRQMLLTLKH